MWYHHFCYVYPQYHTSVDTSGSPLLYLIAKTMNFVYKRNLKCEMWLPLLLLLLHAANHSDMCIVLIDAYTNINKHITARCIAMALFMPCLPHIQTHKLIYCTNLLSRAARKKWFAILARPCTLMYHLLFACSFSPNRLLSLFSLIIVAVVALLYFCVLWRKSKWNDHGFILCICARSNVDLMRAPARS